MIVAVSAPPNIDTSAAVARLAERHRVRPEEDPARAVCRRYQFQTLYDMPAGLQLAVREQLVRDHLDHVSKPGDRLLDYSVAAWLADWMRWQWHATSTRLWAEVLEVARQCASRYDLVYHLETGPVRRYDGYVWLDVENSRQVNGLLHHVHRELGIETRVRYSVE